MSHIPALTEKERAFLTKMREGAKLRWNRDERAYELEKDGATTAPLFATVSALMGKGCFSSLRDGKYIHLSLSKVFIEEGE